MTANERPVRVLVVDDDFMVVKIHRRFVEQLEGFVVVAEARTGDEALRQVEELAPDLVLLDIHLPDISGLEVLRRLRSNAVPVDVLMVTAARDVETVKESLRGGAVQYIVKPFSAQVLHDRLREYDRLRQSLRQIDDGGDGEVGQREVDAIFGVAGRAADPQLPKGLTAPTLQLVANALREATLGGDATISAAEAAEVTGLARVSVRRYLEHLVSVGAAEVRLRYGGSGRPERGYRWTG
ncbi:MULTISPECIES: response regulator [Nocardioides]|uniref:Transcriptional regulatory protein n=1 Tax=Nocardioides vastitatis TaxID=2568655 RepID=A0ABW0ZM67_9ACTN|nr:response regulator [Nocardioides sp.]THJ09216.1 response regulator [Nocardioides sp.]